MKNKYGIYYENLESRKKAEKEAVAIEHIEKTVDKKDQKKLLDIYNTSIRKQLFTTLVGYHYLLNLRDYLIRELKVDRRALLPLTIQSVDDTKIKKKKEKALNISYTINIICILVIIGMFIISQTSKNPTILNYEDKIIHKYELWENELSEREKALDEKEKAFHK